MAETLPSAGGGPAGLPKARKRKQKRHWWQLQKPKFDNVSDELIWRSSDVFGNFDIAILIRIISVEKPNLTKEDLNRLVKRYHDHVAFWNIGYDAMVGDLHRLAGACGVPKNNVIKEFNRLTED